MLTNVNGSTELIRENRSALSKVQNTGAIPLWIFMVLLIAAMFIMTKSRIAGAIVALLSAAFAIFGLFFLFWYIKKSYKKFREGFLAELEREGFVSGVTLDTGRTSVGDPAVIAVDSGKKLVALFLYNNPSEAYIIPAGLITNVWSGKSADTSKVAADFGFAVNGAEFCIPLDVRKSTCCLLFWVSTKIQIANFSRDRFEKGQVDKRFINAVEQADTWANMLRDLSEAER